MKKGFTLIELLVVVAIIGILSSIVLASLNLAREKGKEAAIKSNLKNMVPEAELAYDIVGDYSTVCAGLTKFTTAIANAGGTSGCYTYDNTRWAASVKFISNTTKNWTVDGNGVVTWDVADASSGATMDWTTANTVCASSGGRLPSPEQLRSLFSAHGGVAPPGFVGAWYFSGLLHPVIPNNVYGVVMSSGQVGNINKAGLYHVRCVH